MPNRNITNSIHLNRNLDVKGNYIFPFHFRILGFTLLLFTLGALPFKPAFSFVMLILGLTFAFSRAGTQINKEKKLLLEYNSILFYKFGTWEQYGSIEKIFINPVSYSQYIYTRVNTGTTFRYRKFNAYLKENDENKILLKTFGDKEKLIQEMMILSEYLQVPLVDNSLDS